MKFQGGITHWLCDLDKALTLCISDSLSVREESSSHLWGGYEDSREITPVKVLGIMPGTLRSRCC